MTRRTRRIASLALAALSAGLFFSPAAKADSIWFRTGNAPATETPNVTVARVEGGTIIFTTAGGRESERELAKVWKLKIDSDPALTEAEEAFTTEKWTEAATAYEKAFNGTKKDFVKDRAVTRMAVAAQQSKQFRLQAVAFAMMAVYNQAAAGPLKPSVSPDHKADFPAVIAAVNKAIQTKPSDQLKSFLAQVYVANGQPDAAARVLAGGRSPEMLTAQALVALKLTPPNYNQALQLIEQNKASFVTPDTQMEALYALAEAKAGLAGNDVGRKQDAAIAYMRVVAHFGGRPNSMVEDSLMKAAALLESTGQTAEALSLYNQVKDEPSLAGTATAKKAAEKAKELEAKPKPAAR